MKYTLMSSGLFIMFFLSTVWADNGSLGLAEAIRLAESQNADLARSRLERENLEREIALKIRDFLPELELTYSGNRSVTLGAPDSGVKNINLGVQQLLFSGGRELSALRTMKRDLHMKNLTMEDERADLRFQVMQAFVEILKYRKILDLKEKSYTNILSQLEIARKEYQLGETRRLDCLELELEAAGFSIEMEQVRQKLVESRNTLAQLLFYPREKLPELRGRLNENYRGDLYSQSEVPGFLSRLQNLGQINNRELLAMDYQVIHAREQVRDSRLFWLPVIEAQGDFSVSARDFPLSEPSFSLGLTFSFDLPLVPSDLSLRAGQSNPDEYNRTLTAAADLVENLNGLGDLRIARNNLMLKEMEMEEQKRALNFQIQSLTERLSLSGREILIQRKKLDLMEEKLVILEIQLAQGDLTRLEYVESELAYSNERVSLIENLVTLYGIEESLKNLSGFQTEPLQQNGLIL